MSGVLSIASHPGLQYLPDVTTQESTGCAHFWPFAVVISFFLFAVSISFLLAAGQQRVIQDRILWHWEKTLLFNTEHISILITEVIVADVDGRRSAFVAGSADSLGMVVTEFN